ncbi:MAG TPA: hypothetical protein V6D19_11415 [Stenomitos sp.]
MFSPPFAPETLLPTRDRACWEIAQFLKARLNADYQAIASQLTDPITSAEPVVRGIRDYNAWANTFNEFPLLTVYRRGASGEFLEQVEAAIAYYLPTMALQDQVPGILRWVETRIVRSLQQYDVFFAGQDIRHANLQLQGLRSEYGIGVLPGTEVSAFPFLRINLNFEEIGV